jgi:HKD family nuclease
MINTKEVLLTNPISEVVKNHIKKSNVRLCIAVPFISSFAKQILDHEYMNDIPVKKLITKFDESNINTFDIPTLQYLLKQGFEIQFNNSIHLKLYITDCNAIITSSNLTRGGFENNIELSVKIDSSNVERSVEIFDDLWKSSMSNRITDSLLLESLEKYEVLKKKKKYEKSTKIEIHKIPIKNSLNIDHLIDEIFCNKEDYLKNIDLSYIANKKRNNVTAALIKDNFNIFLFYAPEGHPKRKDSLFYDFVYGAESKLAGTGLREAQYKEAFENPNFKKVIDFILPESIGLERWNFEDDKTFRMFCNGLFDFKIPQYSEAMPIRLASYFYPEVFLPIFKLDHLQDVCEDLGIDVNAKSQGERLFAYNYFLRVEMKVIPFDNYVKANMAYRIFYSMELYNQLENGDSFNEIKSNYNKAWVKDYIDKAKITLENIKAINKF